MGKQHVAICSNYYMRLDSNLFLIIHVCPYFVDLGDDIKTDEENG